MTPTGFFSKVRTYTAFLSTALLHLNAVGIKERGLCAPGFACHGCPWATCACPVGAMAYGSALRVLPAFAIASVLAIGVALGRLVCGYACPFGLLQDLLNKVPTPKWNPPRFTRYGKYLFLLFFVFLFPYLLGFEILGYLESDKPTINKNGADLDVSITVHNPGTTTVKGVELVAVYSDITTGKEVYRSPAPVRFSDVIVPAGAEVKLPVFQVPNKLSSANLSIELPQSRITQTPRHDLYFCKICPVGTLTAHLPKYFQEKEDEDTIYGLAGRNTLRLAIAGAVLLLMFFVSRPFCRMMCPLGAMYALASPFALQRITVDPNACIGCTLCDKACPVGLHVMTEAGGPECISCGDCIDACPKQAIRRRWGF